MVAFLGNAFTKCRSHVILLSINRYFTPCIIRIIFVCLHFLFCQLDLNSIVAAICNRKEMIQRILKVVWSHCWYFFTKIVLTYSQKKMFLWGTTFEIRGRRPRICKNFEITRTIYSNSESSERFSMTECFFNLFLNISHI